VTICRKHSLQYAALFASLAFSAYTLASGALAQQMGSQPPAAQNRPAPTVTGAVKNFYNGVKNNVIRSGEKMPEEFYGSRPGTQEEVRTFGQQLSHIARYNYLWCAEARGEANPNAATDLEKTLKGKDEILKSLRASFDYCDVPFNALNEGNASEVLTITQESGRQVQQTRAGLLMLDLVHTEEVYGSIVTTLRIKNIVPPSSEPRPQRTEQPQKEPNLQ
jgi:uncharacterized damage-inducible protein DinB